MSDIKKPELLTVSESWLWDECIDKTDGVSEETLQALAKISRMRAEELFQEIDRLRAENSALREAAEQAADAIATEWLYQTGQFHRPAQNYPPQGTTCLELHDASLALRKALRPIPQPQEPNQ